ncbi:hypothetical protein LCGC14_2155440 [marine sediment metagenome]|uniref:Uncharacterized protein n=1 Tax=marine sediment metagenome TaxID=412755 RepID=A0A0F9EGL2_9ZZZZ
MLILIGQVYTGRPHVDLLTVRIPTKLDQSAVPVKGRKLTAHLKEVAKKVCGLLNHAIVDVDGGPGGDVQLTLKVSETNPDEAREMFNIVSKELGSMEILWDPISRLRATIGGHASLKGRRRS